MFKSFKFIILLSAMCLFSSPAHAHLGHLGDLAGHSHWLGIGALIAAGVLAAVLGEVSNNDEEETELSDQEDTEAEGTNAYVKNQVS